MSRFTLTLSSGAFELEEDREAVRRELDPSLTRRIERLWQAEQAKRGGVLFDGPIFSLQEQIGNRLRGHSVPYRWWVAQLRDETLGDILQVRPVAVSGLLVVEQTVVFGRRSLRSFQDPGRWEPAPAGGIDPRLRDSKGRLSPEHQLFRELWEELHLPQDEVEALVPIGLLRDSQTGVCDIAYELQSKLDLAQLMEHFADADKLEYSELRCVAKDDLIGFVDDVQVAPIARALIEARGWLP